MKVEQIKRCIAPLGLVFWGGIICAIDITFSNTVNGQGFRFDFLNDVVGTIMVAIGVFRLGAIPVGGNYPYAMSFVKVATLLAICDAIREHFVMPYPPAVQMAIYLVAILVLIAHIVFCLAMRWFCEAANLKDAARSWNVTLWLIAVIDLIPIGSFYIVSFLAIALNKPLKLDLGMFIFVIAFVCMVPIIHLYVSISRTRRAAQHAAVQVETPSYL